MRALTPGLAVIALAGLSVPAASEPTAAKKGDPNEIICEKIEVIGSRLSTKKVCGTRAEWAEKRKQDREVVDQAQRSANGPCNATLTHSGAPTC